MQKRFQIWHLALLAMLLGVLSAVVAAYSWTASLSTFAADDFCFAEIAQNKGIAAAQLHWYFEWNGRYTSNLLISLASLLGPTWASYAVGTAIAILGATASIVALALARAFRFKGPWLAYASAGLLPIVFVLSATPDRFQSIYWMTGALTYTAPLILTMIAAFFLIKGFARSNAEQQSYRSVVIAAAAAFVAAGSSETQAFTQLAILGCVIIAVVGIGGAGLKGHAMLGFWVCAAATLLGCVVIGLAPGNAVRVAFSEADWGGGPVIDPLRAGRIAVWSMHQLVVNIADTSPPYIWFPCVLAPMAIGGSIPIEPAPSEPAIHRLARWLVATPFVVILFAYFAHIPSAVATGGTAATRALVMPTLIVGIGLVAWGFMAGLAIRPTVSDMRFRLWRAWPALCLLTLGTSAMILTVEIQKPVEEAVKLRLARSNWDSFDRAVRLAIQRGDQTVVAGRLANPMGLKEPTEDRTLWVNRCIARFYRIESIGLPSPR